MSTTRVRIYSCESRHKRNFNCLGFVFYASLVSGLEVIFVVMDVSTLFWIWKIIQVVMITLCQGIYTCFPPNTERVDNHITPVASFTKEVNPRLAKRPLKTVGRLANRRLTSFVKEATGRSPLSWITIEINSTYNACLDWPLILSIHKINMTHGNTIIRTQRLVPQIVMGLSGSQAKFTIDMYI